MAYIIDIKDYQTAENITHCNICDQIIYALCNEGFSALENLSLEQSPCMYKTDDIQKYLLRCILESYTDKHNDYIKPTIRSDGKYDHYNNTFKGDYNLEDFLVNGDSDILLVNGEAGIGKSTFMKELFLTVSLFSLRNDCHLIPIFFQGEDFGSDDKRPEEWVQNLLSDRYKYLNFEPAYYNPNVSVVFFIDAINDMQYSTYDDFYKKLDKWQNYIETILGRYKNFKVIISSRYLEYLANFEIRNYTRLFIQPLDDDQVFAFIDKTSISAKQKKSLRKYIAQNEDMPFLRIPFFLNKLLSFPFEILHNKTEVINTFINSIFLKKTHFIRERKETYIEFGKKVTDIRLNGTTFLNALEDLAFKCQSNGTLEFANKDIQEILHADIQNVMDLAINNSIFSKVGNKFAHSIFQEYFSGRKIAKQLPEKYRISDLLAIDSEVPLLQSLKHVYNFIDSKDVFIRMLLENQKIEIAAECVLENKDSKLERLVAYQIADVLKTKKISNESFNVGLLLGRLGDVRFPIDDKDNFFIPPTKFVSKASVKVGIYPVTNREYAFFVYDGGYSNPKYWPSPADEWFNREQKIQSICSFWNHIQDRLNRSAKDFFDFCFKNEFDKELIANLVYFKAISKKDLENMVRDLYNPSKDEYPLMWGNPVYSNPSQPVVGISWFEAYAYCNWLSEKTGKNYRLLTKNEWEQTANLRRTYVYGNRFKKEFSNTVETGLNKIAVVGICSSNCTYDGIYDMSGNIFEWTSSEYQKSLNGALYTQYICKGGSWIQDASRAASSYVGRGMAWVRNLDLGFRVCLDEN